MKRRVLALEGSDDDDIESNLKAPKAQIKKYSHNAKICALIVVGLFMMNLVFKRMVLKDACELLKYMQGSLLAPKIIHQQWKTATIPSGIFSDYNKKWKYFFPEPEFKHMLWTDISQRELIKKHYPWFLNTYDKYPYGIQRADASRYFILHHFGGLYADLDYEPLANFWEYLPGSHVGLIESPYKISENVQNSLMSSPKGDTFWQFVFNALEEKQNNSILSSTGPSLLDYAVSFDDSTVQLPCEVFHRIPLGSAGVNSPLLSRSFRYVLAYTPLSKSCGDWADSDPCQLGIHHNAVSWF